MPAQANQINNLQVTVLLSAHNSAETLDKALESVFTQTTRCNIVCVNDASSDQTNEILAAWIKKLGDKIKVINNSKNIGLTKSLNKGLKEISTTYTARIDADDWWEPTKIEEQVKFLTDNPSHGLVGTWYTNHSNSMSTVVRLPISDTDIRSSIIKRNPFAHSCVVFKTGLIKDLGGYDESVRYGQDYDLWLRCLNKTKLYNLPKILCHRSITGGISIEKQQDQMRQVVRTRLKYIKAHSLPAWNYIYLIEPLLVSLMPKWLTGLKRKITNT